MATKKTKKEAVLKILHREDPGRFVYAPNYWQWNAHRLNQNRSEQGLDDMSTQLEVINELDLDVFSRNVYSNPRNHWFGGLSKSIWDGVEYNEVLEKDGHDDVITRRYRSPEGELSERLRYVHAESTLIQEEFLVKDVSSDLTVLKDIVARRRYKFLPEEWQRWEDKVGKNGVVVAGEFYSPLKLLHLYLGAVETTYALIDYPEITSEIMQLHEEAMVELVLDMSALGVPAMMSMDNLDTMFHPPRYVEEYSASFYQRASEAAHQNGSCFFIHACGQQKANLALIASLGVDGLEGVAYPPLGDVTLNEAMELTGDRFIITGGISAMEFRELDTKTKVTAYVEELLDRMRPYRHRFMLSASCNTPIDAPWERIRWFRDAWAEYGE